MIINLLTHFDNEFGMTGNSIHKINQTIDSGRKGYKIEDGIWYERFHLPF